MIRTPASRLNLPEALSGRFTGLTIATYGADLAFLERFLLPRLARQITNRVLLVDGAQLHKTITSGHGFRRLNRTYATAPINSQRSFHPKFLFLTGPDSGRLLVGSGNASISGYTGAGEAFTQYDWNPTSTEDLGAFTTIREFLHGLHQEFRIDDLAWRLIKDQLDVAQWLNGETSITPVVHNLYEPLLDQFMNQVGSATVTELVTYAPFHDRGARAMEALIERLRPAQLTLLVQPRQTMLDLPALTSVTRPLGETFKVMKIEAPEPYTNVFLHAKFILARTAHLEHLLQGSPNLSAVALCESSGHGNVEMANLQSGPSGAFDSFLANITASPLPNGLQDVIPAAWSDPTPNDASASLLRNLTWAAPDLSGTITQIVEGFEIQVFVGARQMIPISVTATNEENTTQFTMTFGPEDVENLNQSERITIQIHNEPPLPAYPYRVNELLRLSSAGHRIDLLREAGSLDLDDKEIIEILRNLDRIMIVDGRSIWRLVHPSHLLDESDDGDDDSQHALRIRYEDIDWDLIRTHPVYKGYNEAGSIRNTASVTELAILLGSLTDRFRVDAGEIAGGVGESTEDLAFEPDLEDADALDDVLAADDEVEPKRQSARTRVKRLWRSFVQRYVRGLSDERFVEQVGPGIVIPSYVAFNHLCRRLRITGLVDPDFLTTAQIQLWTFMWGSPESQGYLSNIRNSDRRVALEIMSKHKDISATLAAIDDTYWHAWEQGDDLRPLRDSVRAFLSNPEWTVNQTELVGAAKATSTLSVDNAESLLDEIWQLSAHVTEDEVDSELAASANLKFFDLCWTRETILRNGAPEKHQVLHLPNDFDLTARCAASLLTTWANLEPENDYYRVVAGRIIVVREGDEDEALLFNRDTGEQAQVNLGSAELPPWLWRIDQLNSLLAA